MKLCKSLLSQYEALVLNEIHTKTEVCGGLEYLNQKIASFLYQHTDKVNKPKPISKKINDSL